MYPDEILYVGALNIAGVLFWLRILRVFDRHKRWKIVRPSVYKAFFFGMFSVLPALLLYEVTLPASDFILEDFSVVSLLVYETLFVGPIEELSKFFVFFLLVVKSSRIRAPEDGFLQAVAVALGFAFVENFRYAGWYGSYVIWDRITFSMGGHAALAAGWGYAYSLVRFEADGPVKPWKSSMTLIFLVLSASMHGLSNFGLQMHYDSLVIVVESAMTLIAIGLLWNITEHSPFATLKEAGRPSAVRLVQTATRKDPHNLALNRALALHYLKREDDLRAAVYLQRCTEQYPDAQFVSFAEAVVQFKTGRIGPLTFAAWTRGTLGQEPAIRYFRRLRKYIPDWDFKQRVKMILETGEDRLPPLPRWVKAGLQNFDSQI
jgi:RsiW-degrading membrane proteinase PrsW (M82 family)